ncbi:acetate kinase, partial [Fusobacterium nucleatum]
GIEACKSLLPNVKQVAVFDTAFHQTMPPINYLYAIPYKFYEKYKIRRYGFHGTSHMYITNRTAEILGKDVNEINLITCHLGNGSSITAVKNGKSYDTSM